MKLCFGAISKHARRWKDPVEILCLVCALAISAFALHQSNRALRLQSDEFHLRNRPLMDITEARFGGSAKDKDTRYPHSVEFSLENVLDIPATHLEGKAVLALDGQDKVTTLIRLGSLAKGRSWIIPLGLTREVYEYATNSGVKTTCRIAVTYSGMLKENPAKYRTTCTIEYWPERGTFSFGDRQYE